MQLVREEQPVAVIILTLSCLFSDDTNTCCMCHGSIVLALSVFICLSLHVCAVIYWSVVVI